jgi:lipid II:glycine glycyltransferase (peptidoglycan interpeptide bridge formation enzyme)
MHMISLEPDLPTLYSALHHDSIQRKIKRAERESVDVGEYHSEALDSFISLHSMTRRRHGVPPQPSRWFDKLVRLFGNDCTIYLARIGGQPVGALFTLRFGTTLVYKYGASDATFHATGAMPFLFWHVIQMAKKRGLQKLDLGRCDLSNQGLIRFKEHLGASARRVSCFRCGSSGVRSSMTFHSRVLSGLLSMMPPQLTNAAGKLLYRHVG